MQRRYRQITVIGHAAQHIKGLNIFCTMRHTDDSTIPTLGLYQRNAKRRSCTPRRPAQELSQFHSCPLCRVAYIWGQNAGLEESGGPCETFFNGLLLFVQG